MIKNHWNSGMRREQARERQEAARASAAEAVANTSNGSLLDAGAMSMKKKRGRKPKQALSCASPAFTMSQESAVNVLASMPSSPSVSRMSSSGAALDVHLFSPTHFDNDHASLTSPLVSAEIDGYSDPYQLLPSSRTLPAPMLVSATQAYVAQLEQSQHSPSAYQSQSNAALSPSIARRRYVASPSSSVRSLQGA